MLLTKERDLLRGRLSVAVVLVPATRLQPHSDPHEQRAISCPHPSRIAQSSKIQLDDHSTGSPVAAGVRGAVTHRTTTTTAVAASVGAVVVVGTLGTALTAASELATTGIDAEVIDLRVLRPLDDATVMDSVHRTHRAVIVDEGWRSGSLAAEISARIMEQAFYDLDAPVARVCSAEVPIPYARHMEAAALPQPAGIVTAVRELVG